MPGTTPPTSQLDWLNSTTAMIVLFWSRATRDLLKSFGWGIAALHRLDAATKLPFPRRPPHSIALGPAFTKGSAVCCPRDIPNDRLGPVFGGVLRAGRGSGDRSVRGAACLCPRA